MARRHRHDAPAPRSDRSPDLRRGMRFGDRVRVLQKMKKRNADKRHTPTAALHSILVDERRDARVRAASDRDRRRAVRRPARIPLRSSPQPAPSRQVLRHAGSAALSRARSPRASTTTASSAIRMTVAASGTGSALMAMPGPLRGTISLSDIAALNASQACGSAASFQASMMTNPDPARMR